jgi:pimeloyl-ACP methyl ester carboxylesterase
MSDHINDSIDRRTLLSKGAALAAALGFGMATERGASIARAAGGSAIPPYGLGPLDAKREAKKIAFDRAGSGEKVLMISGFPSTRYSWHKIVPLMSSKYELIVADLPSFGDSGFLEAPASTENVARVFHEFVKNFGAPIHVVAHDFGAWCAYSWALLFPNDFKSLTLIEAGIPGVTLPPTVELSDYKRKWNFIFQMLPDLPAELTQGKEDIYVGWWYKNKVYSRGSISAHDVAIYVKAYSRPGRMDAAFDYCRNILVDIEFNKKQYTGKLPMRLLAVGGAESIPQMGESLRPLFQNTTSVVIPESGHFVPEEQPQSLAKALLAFLS